MPTRGPAAGQPDEPRRRAAAWQRVATPNPAGPSQGNELAAVAARAVGDAWAAGGDGGYPEASLVLHWNGTTWAQVRVPSIGALDAVTVASANVWVASGNKVAVLPATRAARLSDDLDQPPPGQGA